ncbi:hypothetical protein [Reinekea sp.]|nr:hypothetical protein [Reinekea sp.]
MILNSATLKDSYANYEKDAAALGKALSAPTPGADEQFFDPGF